MSERSCDIARFSYNRTAFTLTFVLHLFINMLLTTRHAEQIMADSLSGKQRKAPPFS